MSNSPNLPQLVPEEREILLRLLQSIPLNYKKFNKDNNSVDIVNSHVRALTIQNQSFESIPPELYEFSQLEEAYFYCNRLTVMPDISRWPKLRILALGGNQIRKIEIRTNHPALERLEIGRNQITKIEDLKKLSHLRILYLNSNRIQQIEGLETLNALQELNLAGNELTRIVGLDKNLNLEELVLWGNQIKRIENLDPLVKLRVLELENNRIERIEGLGALVHIQELTLDRNPLNPEFANYDKQTAQYWVNSCQNSVKGTTLPIISCIGRSDSGKTTCIETMINYLTMQHLPCLAFKHIHQENFTADTPGKNTWRFSQAGAKAVVAQSAHESAIFINHAISPVTLLTWLHQLLQTESLLTQDNPPIVLLEGFRDLGPQVLCVSSLDDVEEQISPSVKIISGKIASDASAREYLEKKYQIPVIDGSQNPEKILEALHLK